MSIPPSHARSILDFLCPPQHALFDRGTLEQFLSSRVFQPAARSASPLVDAERWLQGPLRHWLFDAGGYLERWRHSPLVYRADGAQEIGEMLASHGLDPFRRRECLPAFWTPFHRVAEVYAYGHSEPIWAATIADGEPYWLLPTRDCVTECVQLINITKQFVSRVLGLGYPLPVTTEADVNNWFDTVRYRNGWPGDLLAVVLYVLRRATNRIVVPNMVVFDGNWDTSDHPSTSPEIIFLHPAAIASIEAVPN